MTTGKGMCALVDQLRRHRARNRHDRADGQINAAGGNHQRHSQREQHYLGAMIQDVDQRAVEVAVADFNVEKSGRKKRIEN